VKKSKSNKKHSHRRTFTPEFKQEAVKLTKEPNQSIAKVAENLGVSASAVRGWVNQDEAGEGIGGLGIEKNGLVSRICGSIQELVVFQADDTRLFSAFLGS